MKVKIRCSHDGGDVDVDLTDSKLCGLAGGKIPTFRRNTLHPFFRANDNFIRLQCKGRDHS